MTSTFDSNSGIHQLPSSCYPPSESDDEDSFVVLNNSLGPDIHTDRAHFNTEPISTQTIQASLDSIADILPQQIQAIQNKEIENQDLIDSSHIAFPSTEISADEIQKKVDNLIVENLKLKETLAQNNIAMKKQVDTITQWQEEVQKVQKSHKEKFSHMKDYIKILKAENEQLKDILKKSDVENDSKKEKQLLIKQTDNIKQFEFEACNQKIKEFQKALDILSLEKESLGKTLSEKEQEMSNIIADKELLTYELNLSREREMSRQTNFSKEMQLLKDEIVELRDTNNNLVDKISYLQDENDKLRTEITDREEKLCQANSAVLNLEEDLTKTKQQLMASQMYIICEKDKEISSLQCELEKFKLSADENAALRAQLDLYKNDFEMEREQRKELLDEKNKIADNLQQLQRRNNQLHEEIDQLRSGFVPVKKEEVHTPPSDQYRCPRCGFKFRSYQALENHVYRCIELDSLP